MRVRLPDSYRKLSRFARRYRDGAPVYEQGTVPGSFYIVLSGRVHFRVLNTNGELATVGEVLPGSLLGHVAAFTQTPTSAAAIAAGDCVLLAVPVEEAVEAFRVAPELALHLIEEFASSSRWRRVRIPTRDGVDDVGATSDAGDGAARPQAVTATRGGPSLVASGARPPAQTAAPVAPAAAAAPVGASGGQPSAPAQPKAAPAAAAARADADVVRLSGTYDDESFFEDVATCPICATRFEYLRVRTKAVRPANRDTDFHIEYGSVDPTHYSLVCCPKCGYTAYHEEFDELDDRERVALAAGTDARRGAGLRPVCGIRSRDDAALAIDLALLCLDQRRSPEGATKRGADRRRAVLLHRRAWIERERGDAKAERRLLDQARLAYRASFEGDTTLADETAMRAAYLIGDLSLRLGEPEEAGQWLETALRFPEAKSQTGLARMVRERLADARQALKQSAA